MSLHEKISILFYIKKYVLYIHPYIVIKSNLNIGLCYDTGTNEDAGN